MEKGDLFSGRGDIRGAVKRLEGAVLREVAGDNPLRLVQLTTRLMKIYREGGFYDKAFAELRRAETVIENVEDAETKAKYYNQAGELYLLNGYVDTSLAFFEKAEDFATVAKNPEILAGVLNNTGNAQAVAGRLELASSAFREALYLLGMTENSGVLKATVLINLCRSEKLRGNGENVGRILEQALSFLRNGKGSEEKAKALVALGLLMENTKGYPGEPGVREKNQTVLSLYDRAYDMALSVDDYRTASYAMGLAGGVLEKQNRIPDALSSTWKAVYYSRDKAFYPDILYLWLWQLARIYDKSEETDKARRFYRHAVETLNPVRWNVWMGYRGREDVFSEKIKPVYLGLSDILLRHFKKADNIKEKKALLIEARETMEQLKVFEIQDFFRDECVVANRENMGGDGRVGETEAVLYPISFENRVGVIVMTGKGVHYRESSVDGDILEATARRFRFRLQFEKNRDYVSDARTLYEWLVKPVEDLLSENNTQTLIVVPDGILRLIPYAALHDGNRFLIEKYAVTIAPAFSVIPMEREKKDAFENVLLEGVSESRHGFSPLPGVVEELLKIQNILGGKILRDEAFTLENMRNAFREKSYSVVHMATHGVFGKTAEDTYLLTHDDRLTMDRLERLIKMGEERGESVDLLTLSACQTAVGDERAAFGLAGVALKAGAESAVATLWLVNDAATNQLMTDFYSQLKKKMNTRAKALQTAQLHMLQGGAFDHPGFWAPFLMIGNWR